MATYNQSKQQANTNKAGTYKASGFVPSKQQAPKKSISLLDILLGKK